MGHHQADHRDITGIARKEEKRKGCASVRSFFFLIFKKFGNNKGVPRGDSIF